VCTGPEFERLPQADKDRMLTYMELAGTKWLVAAVRRVYDPGCRVDNMLILEGGQGALKSTTLKVLGDRWFTDATLRFEDKDSLLIIQGRWIVEMAELEGMNKADTSATKKFLTQHVDLFRPPYGRKLVQYPRRCIFAGSVNHDIYLKDDSGNRRFWPVRVESIDIDRLRADVDQLWAEAAALHKAGVPHWVLPHEKPLFEEAQEARFDTDAWEETVLDYLDGAGEFALSTAGSLNKVKTDQIMTGALKLDKARWDRQAKIRVVGILRRNGWFRRKDSAGSRQWWYVRPEPADPSLKVGPQPAGQEGGGDEPF
jgi:predicted P-loop ATPase